MEKLRTVRFSPYRKGHGPVFTLTTYDAGTRYEDKLGSRQYIGYRLTISDPGEKPYVLFQGDDIGLPRFGSDAIDSDATIKSVMGWLTLKPGDTDEDYFAKYNNDQLGFAAMHAEALLCEVNDRYGWED